MGEDITKLKKSIENIKKVIKKKVAPLLPKEEPKKGKLPWNYGKLKGLTRPSGSTSPLS